MHGPFGGSRNPPTLLLGLFENLQSAPNRTNSTGFTKSFETPCSRHRKITWALTMTVTRTLLKRCNWRVRQVKHRAHKLQNYRNKKKSCQLLLNLETRKEQQVLHGLAVCHMGGDRLARALLLRCGLWRNRPDADSLLKHRQIASHFPLTETSLNDFWKYFGCAVTVLNISELLDYVGLIMLDYDIWLLTWHLTTWRMSDMSRRTS